METLTVSKHLAGIVPIANNESFFNMPWHDSLMPIGHNYLAIEKAIFDCALAGCDTIWVIGHMNMQPLIRKRVGEMIFDPLKSYSNKEMVYKRHDIEAKRKEIQIYYVPIHPKDRDRRDSLAYSVIYAASIAYKTCFDISKWASPDVFFCSFPYGIVSEESMYEFRKHANKKKSTLMVYEGKTVKDNLMLPFTFTYKDFMRCKNHLNEYAVSVWENAKNDDSDLPTIHYSIKDVFNCLDASESSLVQCSWFHQINNWNGYKNFLNSQHSEQIKMRTDLWCPETRSALDFEDKKDDGS
jgi:hypothetical protein